MELVASASVGDYGNILGRSDRSVGERHLRPSTLLANGLIASSVVITRPGCTLRHFGYALHGR